MSDVIAQTLSMLRTSVDRWAAIARVDADLPGRPLVSASLVMRNGAADEPPAHAGATVLAARAMTEGTDRYDAIALVEAAERLPRADRQHACVEDRELGVHDVLERLDRRPLAGRRRPGEQLGLDPRDRRPPVDGGAEHRQGLGDDVGHRGLLVAKRAVHRSAHRA